MPSLIPYFGITPQRLPTYPPSAVKLHSMDGHHHAEPVTRAEKREKNCARVLGALRITARQSSHDLAAELRIPESSVSWALVRLSSTGHLGSELVKRFCERRKQRVVTRVYWVVTKQEKTI